MLTALSCRDSRSLKNRLHAEMELEQHERGGDFVNEVPAESGDPYNGDPTQAARDHGNRPSRGAEIDKQLKEDDELRLKEKGQA